MGEPVSTSWTGLLAAFFHNLKTSAVGMQKHSTELLAFTKPICVLPLARWQYKSINVTCSKVHETYMQPFLCTLDAASIML